MILELKYNLPGHSKKSLHKNRGKRGNSNISLQCCCLLPVGCWGQGSNAKVSSGPISRGGTQPKGAHSLCQGGSGGSHWIKQEQKRQKQSLPSYCQTLKQTTPNFQKSSRKREEEQGQDRASSKPPKSAHAVAVPAFLKAAAHRSIHPLNNIFTE